MRACFDICIHCIHYTHCIRYIQTKTSQSYYTYASCHVYESVISHISTSQTNNQAARIWFYTPKKRDLHTRKKSYISDNWALVALFLGGPRSVCMHVCLLRNTTLLHTYIRAKYLAHEPAPHYAWARHSCPVTGHPSLRPPRKSAIPRTADRRQPSDTQCRI